MLTKPLNRTNKRKASAPGANLAFIVIVLVVVIAFLGLAIVSGLSTLIQDELNKATSQAAMVGASSLYDGDTTSLPVKDTGIGETAATATFNRAVQSSGVLTGLNATLQSVASNAGADTVTVNGRMQLPLPFLSIVGLSQLEINTQATSKALKQAPTGFPVTLFSPSATNTSGGLVEVGTPADTSCGALPAVNPAATSLLRVPVTDRKGPDIRVENSDGRGYLVFACNATNCWDVTGGAKMDAGGTVRSVTYGTGDTYRVLYGSASIDLGATSPTYAGTVNKATRIRIVDDGLPDRMVAGQRQLEPCPQGVTINAVYAYHSAGTCVRGSNTCTIPAGFQAM